MTDKFFSTTVLVLGTPMAIGSLIAMFYNPFHVFTAAVMCAFVAAVLFEPDEDGENLWQAIRRRFRL